jgi:hypothetical protein
MRVRAVWDWRKAAVYAPCIVTACSSKYAFVIILFLAETIVLMRLIWKVQSHRRCPSIVDDIHIHIDLTIDDILKDLKSFFELIE